MGGIIDRILAAVTQRDFCSEAQIKALVCRNGEKRRRSQRVAASSGTPDCGETKLRAIRFFGADRQRTWLVIDGSTAYCVIDDRNWEEPWIQWQAMVGSLLPVRVEETQSETSGVLHFGGQARATRYSKHLFANEPVEMAIARFLSGAQAPVAA